MAISKEEILAEIRKYVAVHGESPGEREFAAETRIRKSAWKHKIWVNWTDAVREAGYVPKSFMEKIPDGDILAQLASLISQMDEFPVTGAIDIHARKTPGFPIWQTIKRRFVDIPGTSAAHLEFSRSTGNEKLRAVCEARIARESSKPARSQNGKRQPSHGKSGFVYLKYSRSLRLYKIGKANDSNKRGTGISLLLPDDLVPKHEIKTDCPFILEKYWHNRFRTKKRQGGWFELNRADVEAFKTRRQFMFCEFFP